MKQILREYVIKRDLRKVCEQFKRDRNKTAFVGAL